MLVAFSKRQNLQAINQLKIIVTRLFNIDAAITERYPPAQ